MHYSEFAQLYDSLGKTTKKLEKTKLIAAFLPELKGHEEWIYLLRARVFPDYDMRELGISTQLTVKAIAKASGVASERVVERFKTLGDLGDVAAELAAKRNQEALFSKPLQAQHLLERLQRLSSIQGSGTVEKKIDGIVELLLSATPNEARYVIRTIMGDLRVGVAEALILDAVSSAFFPEDEEMRAKVSESYSFITDFAEILRRAFKGKKAFDRVTLNPGRPFNVMLAVKSESFEEAFRICGKPAAIEHKYDGFRALISCTEQGTVQLFTRRLEEVTLQFPDVIELVKKHVNARSFIFDSEIVGFDPKTKKYLPFEAISQRIKRKYDIKELQDKLPVEINIFDVLYVDGETIIEKPFSERRKLLKKLIKEAPLKIRLSQQIVTDDEEEAVRFYEEALTLGEEGVMIKKIEAPYRPGRAVGYMAKLKPIVADLDLVIVGGEYGTGKRAGGITSFIVACKRNGEFLEVGRVSSGLKEKASEGTSYGELNALMQPLITHEEGNTVYVKPKLVVSVTYQNIQKSPSYSSGYALRFPRITHYRPERGTNDIASLADIEHEVSKSKRK